MDVLKLLKSFEEFVYEALTWLVLMPRTLWRIVRSPRRMTAYASAQLASDSDARFSDAISPPLLLILSVLLCHAIDLAVSDPVVLAGSRLGGIVLSSEQYLLLYRTIAFGVWSLAGAVLLLAWRRQAVDRESLRAPLYEQCYLVAPFAVATSLSLTLIGFDRPSTLVAGVLLVLLASAWFWGVQAAWFRDRAPMGLAGGLLAATLVLLVGSAINAGLVQAFGAGDGPPGAAAPAAQAP